ncbi:hypothetical protein J1614_008108 [Plenodomus biglobosus]|nr:hypothetical protein J1614_008108 [Plenodomus biglobosus]
MPRSNPTHKIFSSSTSETRIRKSDISRPIPNPDDLPHQLDTSAITVSGADTSNPTRCGDPRKDFCLPSLTSLESLSLESSLPRASTSRTTPTQDYYRNNPLPPLSPPAPLKISKATHAGNYHHHPNPYTSPQEARTPGHDSPFKTSPPNTFNLSTVAPTLKDRARHTSGWVRLQKAFSTKEIADSHSPSVYSSEASRSVTSPSSPISTPRKPQPKLTSRCLWILCGVLVLAALAFGISVWVQVHVIPRKLVRPTPVGEFLTLNTTPTPEATQENPDSSTSLGSLATLSDHHSSRSSTTRLPHVSGLASSSEHRTGYGSSKSPARSISLSYLHSRTSSHSIATTTTTVITTITESSSRRS